MTARHSLQRWSRLGKFMWPSGNRFLQLRVVICVFILVLTRILTVMVPVIYKRLINSLTLTERTKGATEPPWQMIIFYIVMKSMYGSGGYLNTLRHLLWIPVSQGTNKKLRVELFNHILRMSLRWHLQRKTGEVLRVVDRGITSVEVILNEIVFMMMPAVVDITVAIVFFIAMFDFWTGLIIGFSTVGYIGMTLVLSKWKAHYRREKNMADNERQAAIVDAILNFETVKYYSAEDWEVKRYEEALDKHMHAEWLMAAWADLRQSGRRTIMSLGLAIGSLLCALYVQTGEFTVGDYVLFVSYLEQVYGPLNSVGDYYKRLHQASIDMENMFDMLEEVPDVVDSPSAEDVTISGGKIEFQNVTFHYSVERPILKNVTFTVMPGETVAIVGHSGSGKSTLVRLLLRFYDISSGKILIDGKDIREFQQKSLRQQIGVVPQDTVLFNRDIEYNIRYGRPTATDKEVVDAAISADVHKSIVSFVDGYSTKVGERGLKLSGGEKQRIAIARTVLKRAKIMLLDEATSSLDTKTERTIQSALSHICKQKTTIVVAHRLSTVVHANRILVIDNGQVIESGTHEELYAMHGQYWEMWEAQLKQKRRRSEEAEMITKTGEDVLEESDEWDEEESGASEEQDDNADFNNVIQEDDAVLVRKRTTHTDDGIRSIPK